MRSATVCHRFDRPISSYPDAIVRNDLLHGRRDGALVELDNVEDSIRETRILEELAEEVMGPWDERGR